MCKRISKKQTALVQRGFRAGRSQPQCGRRPLCLQAHPCFQLDTRLVQNVWQDVSEIVYRYLGRSLFRFSGKGTLHGCTLILVHLPDVWSTHVLSNIFDISQPVICNIPEKPAARGIPSRHFGYTSGHCSHDAIFCDRTIVTYFQILPRKQTVTWLDLFSGNLRMPSTHHTDEIDTTRTIHTVTKHPNRG